MSKTIILFLLFLIAFPDNTVERSSDLLDKNFFKHNEYIKYKLIYKYSEAWVQAGHVTFEFEEKTINKKDYIVFIAKGNTSPAFDLFYKVRDEYATIVNPKTLLPKYFFRRVNEGGFRIKNDLEFNHDSLDVRAITEDTKHPLDTSTLKIVKNTQDLLSAILYCRTLKYNFVKEGHTFKFPLFIDNEIHQVGVKYLGKKDISTDYGDFKCLVLQPLLLSGRVFDETNKMRIYMTDDSYRVPVLIESPLKVGKVLAVIKKYKFK